MTDERIYQLGQATNVTDTSFFANEDSSNSNVTEKISLLQISEYIEDKLLDPLVVANGGTGISSPTAHKMLIAEGSSAMNLMDVMTTGQVAGGVTGADPQPYTLVAGTNMTSVIPDAKAQTITFNAAGGSVSTGANTLNITPNGNDSTGDGTLSKPLLTLAGANALIAANPSTKYNVFDYRKTASENFVVQPNANYFAYGTIITPASSVNALGSGWGGANQSCTIDGYNFSIGNFSINFDFHLLSQSFDYALTIQNCSGNGTGSGVLQFDGFRSNYVAGHVPKVDLFDCYFIDHSPTSLSSLNISVLNGVWINARNGACNNLTFTMNQSGVVQLNIYSMFSGFRPFGQVTINGDASSGGNYLRTNFINCETISSAPIINANQGSVYDITLIMDASTWRSDTVVNGAGNVSIETYPTIAGLDFTQSDVNFGYVSPYGFAQTHTDNFGSRTNPYPNLTSAMDTILALGNTSNDPNHPIILKFLGSVDDTGNTTNLLPNMVIDLNGFTWTHGNVSRDLSWTKASFDGATFTMKNGFLLPASSGTHVWNTDFISEHDINLDFTWQNINTTHRLIKPVQTYTFSVGDDGSSSPHFFFNDCNLSDLNDSGSTTIELNGNGEFYFGNGLSPAILKTNFVFGDSANVVFSGTFINSNSAFNFNGTYIYICDIGGLFWQGRIPIFLLRGGCYVYYDSSVLNNSYFVDGKYWSGTAIFTPGSGYTTGTATASATLLPGGHLPTANPVFIAGALTALSLMNTGAGITSAITWSISGDGSGASATTPYADLGSFNTFNPQTTDEVIIPLYSPTNYTPTITNLGITPFKALYGHLEGIDTKLGTLGPTGYQSSTNSTPVTLTSTIVADVANITLTAGNWDITGLIHFGGGAVTLTFGGFGFEAFFGTLAGNNITGQNLDTNTIWTQEAPTTNSDVIIAMPTVRVTVGSSQTYYLKCFGSFTAGTPTATGTIRAIQAS